MGSERRLERHPGARAAGATRTRRSIAHRRSFVERNRGTILAVVGVAVIGALIVIAVLQAANAGETTANAPSTPADPAVVDAVTTLPASLFDDVGPGTAGNPPRAVPDAAVAGDGSVKPELLFVSGEFCPFCASERWPLVIALSRFGSFEGLSATRSAADDIHPNTATLSFYGSTYESSYLTFDAVEMYSNQRTANGYAPLQQLTGEQAAIYNQYSPGGGIPFLYIDGEYILSGTNYSLELLAGLNWSQIAAAIEQPGSRISDAVVGSANLLTAAICRTTDGQPGEVCQSPGVQQAAALLP